MAGGKGSILDLNSGYHRTFTKTHRPGLAKIPDATLAVLASWMSTVHRQVWCTQVCNTHVMRKHVTQTLFEDGRLGYIQNGKYP